MVHLGPVLIPSISGWGGGPCYKQCISQMKSKTPFHALAQFVGAPKSTDAPNTWWIFAEIAPLLLLIGEIVQHTLQHDSGFVMKAHTHPHVSRYLFLCLAGDKSVLFGYGLTRLALFLHTQTHSGGKLGSGAASLCRSRARL